MSTLDQPRPTAQNLGSRLEFETLIADTSASLFAVPPEELERTVQRALERVRVFFQADRCVQPDVIVECTGVGQVIGDSIEAVAAGGVVCLTGVGSGGRTVGLNTADVASNVVLHNNVVVGSVNANKRHWYRAGRILARADREWLARLVTRCEAPADFKRALARQPDDIKVVIQFAEA